MIRYIADSRLFQMFGATTYYALAIGDDGRLAHVGWGVLGDGASSDTSVATGQKERFDDYDPFDMQRLRDEVLTFGDYTYHEVALKVTFPPAPDARAEGLPGVPIRDLRLRYASHEIVADAEPGLAPRMGGTRAEGSPRKVLRVRLEDPTHPFAATLCLRLTPEYDIVERWLELENTGTEPVVVEQCGFGNLHLPPGEYELMHLTGRWGSEFWIQRDKLPQGMLVLESRTSSTSPFHNPAFMLNRAGEACEDRGEVYFGCLAYSGNWRLAFEHNSDFSLKVIGGYNPFDFEMVLRPREKHVTPAFVHGCAADGWGGASRRLHAFGRKYVLPRGPTVAALRPILYNSWENTGYDVRVDEQIDLARKAAAIGVELFCIDDGWFGERRRRTSGIGDWWVRKDAFPNGLDPLISEVRRLGMTFGIWVEPEMVNPDSDMYRAHPDWVLHFPGRPRTTEKDELILDLGRPEVVEDVHGALDRLLREFQIDFMKWDMNRSASEPGSVSAKAVWRRHVEGVYGIIDRLRADHPSLSLEACSGGGGRIDWGILGRVDQVWPSDNTDPFDRIRIQEGFSYIYPARTMECWVTSPQESRNDNYDLRFDIAMRGALGIGAALDQLSDEQMARFGERIAFYKRIRRVVQLGHLHRLLLLDRHGVSAIEYVTGDGSEAVLSVAVVDPRAGYVSRVRLRGLVAGASYSVRNRGGSEVARLTGSGLMSEGLLLSTGGGFLQRGYSSTLHLMME